MLARNPDIIASEDQKLLDIFNFVHTSVEDAFAKAPDSHKDKFYFPVKLNNPSEIQSLHCLGKALAVVYSGQDNLRALWGRCVSGVFEVAKIDISENGKEILIPGNGISREKMINYLSVLEESVKNQVPNYRR